MSSTLERLQKFRNETIDEILLKLNDDKLEDSLLKILCKSDVYHHGGGGASEATTGTRRSEEEFHCSYCGISLKVTSEFSE